MGKSKFSWFFNSKWQPGCACDYSSEALEEEFRKFAEVSYKIKEEIKEEEPMIEE
jgi:hypothetical protein